MSETPPLPPPRRSALRLQEGGLLVVIFVLGLLLTIFGGTVKVPAFQTNAQGERERVFRTNAQGDREAVVVERNRFLNAQNLAQLAKDTSINAIMAVGATFVIISGGIDLSVAAIYALASVLGALVFHHFGSDGPGADSPGVGFVLGTLICVGSATIAGALNGGMIVALRVHPFIITLGTMSIFRGIAFVITNGQSIGGFPQTLRNIIRWEVGDGIFPVPPLIMVFVAIIGGIYLS